MINMLDVYRRPSHEMKAPHQAQKMTLAHVRSTKPYGTWRVNHYLLGDGNEMGYSHIHVLVMHQDLNNSDFFQSPKCYYYSCCPG